MPQNPELKGPELVTSFQHLRIPGLTWSTGNPNKDKPGQGTSNMPHLWPRVKAWSGIFNLGRKG